MKKKEKKKDGPLAWAFAILLALTLRWGLAESYAIPSGSMLPSLLIHDHIFVNKIVYGIRVPFSKMWLVKFKQPERGEVIVFKDPRDNDTFLIKRLIGLPGDKLEYHENQLFINGQQVEATEPVSSKDFDLVPNEDLEGQKSDHIHLNEHISGHDHSVLHLKFSADRDQSEIVIPPDTMFMMGDHRDNSADSRFWGPAPMENILGRASFVWMSCTDPLPLVNVFCSPFALRWGRFFHVIN